MTAEHSDVAPREVLGTSTGKPDQRFTVPQHAGAAADARRDDRRSIDGDVDDGVDRGARLRRQRSRRPPLRVELDDRRGPLRSADPLPRRHDAASTARVPREGALIVATGYRYGGGAAGNVGAGDARPTCARRCRTSTGSRTSPPAIGGVDAETVDNAKRRGPHSLRAGGRAVTVEDFERLASEADPAIARVRCLPPDETGKPIRLLRRARTSSGPASCSSSTTSPSPTTWSRRVSEHLDERRILGTAIEIGTPYYQGVTIAALLTARPGRPVDAGARAGAGARCTATSTR